MHTTILESRLKAELAPLNEALDQACRELPKPVQPVARHIFGAGGKRLRPFLTICAARLCGQPGDDIHRLAITMEMLHAATLLHDDVLDKAEKRRGQAAAHTVFNPLSVILAGDALLASANAIVADFGDPALCLCFSKATSRTAAGEILEISAVGRVDLAHEEYLEIALGKTACLLGESCRLGALCVHARDKLVQALYDFGINLGLAFQIVDDALDFAPEAQTGKPTGGDAREGKLTTPLRLYRDDLDPERREIFDREFAGGLIDARKAEQIALEIREKGYDAKARAIASQYLEKAREALDPFATTPDKEALIQMTEYVGTRIK